jgi:predicted thioesterase
LPEGNSTVGTMINIKHIAATPVGMNITAKAELIEVNEKRLIFKIEAFDDKEKIGEGTHERYIISIDKFVARVYSKKDSTHI